MEVEMCGKMDVRQSHYGTADSFPITYKVPFLVLDLANLYETVYDH